MTLRTFAAETRGNVAMLVAFSLIPLMGAGAIAVDYTYAETMKVKLAAAADSAALAGAQLFNGAAKQRADRAAATFESSLSQLQGVKKVKFEASDVTDKGVYTGFKVEASAEAETIFAKIIGIDILKIGVSAESVLGDGSKMEIALVLDTTGSMAGAKMDNLKIAANGLVKTLSEKALVAGSMKFSLVPFAQYVNVGLANRNQSWISVPPDTSVAKTGCWKESQIVSKNNCKIVKQTYLNDGVPVTYDQEVCDITYGPEVEVCGNWTETSVWNGCAGSRNYPLNKQDGGYGTPVPGLANQDCPAALTPLTSNTSVITAGINAMYAAGETYIPGGLIWGWRTLSPQAPFSESEKGTSGSKVNQYNILMTDGAIRLPRHTPIITMMAAIRRWRTDLRPRYARRSGTTISRCMLSLMKLRM